MASITRTGTIMTIRMRTIIRTVTITMGIATLVTIIITAMNTTTAWA